MVKWQIGLECMGEIIGKREMSNACPVGKYGRIGACPACPVAKRIRVGKYGRIGGRFSGIIFATCYYEKKGVNLNC